MPSIRELLRQVRYREWTPAVQVRIPQDQVTGLAVADSDPSGDLSPGQSYFRVVVDGLALDYARVGTRTFDPMLLTVTDYLYDGKVVSVPFVISSKLVAAEDGLPQGMVFANTCVAGPHPYYGQLAVAVVLYRIERDDYARRLLDAAQRTCAAFDVTGSLSAYLKMADAVLDGVEAVLGHTHNEPVLGFRTEFSDLLQSGTYAVLPAPIPAGDLRLSDGVLCRKTAGATTPLAQTNHVVYSVRSSLPADLQTLPWFGLLWNRIVRWANIPSDEAKAVAQDYLAALYEELQTSPDIARDTAESVYTEWENRAKAIHVKAKMAHSWGPGELRQDALRERVLEIREPW